MLNYETLLSSYDDKLTLLQWLKKVEAALKDASAVDFKVNKKGDATLTFSIVFDDGSELESGEIVLQQGESVQSAAIVNGHLILTLTNGDELDAGQLLNGDLNVSGNLAATGKITGAEIVEDMTGYSLDGAYAPPASYTRDYIGCVKNGNKLTLAVAGTFTPTGSEGGAFNFFAFHLPLAVYEKLQNIDIAGDASLSLKELEFYSTIRAQPIRKNVNLIARYNALIAQFPAYMNQDFVAGTTYYYRYEITLLLGDNLAA